MEFDAGEVIVIVYLCGLPTRQKRLIINHKPAAPENPGTDTIIPVVISTRTSLRLGKTPV